jgi:hypothetical protein
MIDEMEEIPRDTVGFIEMLNALYPHRCLRLGEDIDAYVRFCGMREMIDELMVVKQEMEEGDASEDT